MDQVKSPNRLKSKVNLTLDISKAVQFKTGSNDVKATPLTQDAFLPVEVSSTTMENRHQGYNRMEAAVVNPLANGQTNYTPSCMTTPTSARINDAFHSDADSTVTSSSTSSSRQPASQTACGCPGNRNRTAQAHASNSHNAPADSSSSRVSSKHCSYDVERASADKPQKSWRCVIFLGVVVVILLLLVLTAVIFILFEHPELATSSQQLSSRVYSDVPISQAYNYSGLSDPRYSYNGPSSSDSDVTNRSTAVDTNAFITTMRLAQVRTDVRRPDAHKVAPSHGSVDEHPMEVLNTWTTDDLESLGDGYEYAYEQTDDGAASFIVAVVITEDALYELNLHATVHGYSMDTDVTSAGRDGAHSGMIMYYQQVVRSGRNGDDYVIDQPQLLNCPNLDDFSAVTGCATVSAQRKVHLRRGDRLSIMSSHRHLLQEAQTWFSIMRIDKV